MKTIRKSGLAALAFAMAMGATAQEQDDFPSNPMHGIEGCTADGQRATWFFKFDMDLMYLHKAGLEGYRVLLGNLQETVTRTILPEWDSIIQRYPSADIKSGNAAPESEINAVIQTALEKFGKTEDGTPNVWIVHHGGGLRSGTGHCAPAAPTI